MKIFSVEDNADIRELLSFSLAAFGYDVTVFTTAEEMLEAVSADCLPDLFLIDIMLPGMSGIEALIKLRAEPVTAKTPVILLTAKSSEMNIVQGLEAGADDYITKPFSVVELAARIKANTRRNAPRAHIIEEGGVRMDLTSREVAAGGKPVHLTVKEFELLKTLLCHPNEVLDRERLLKEVWGYDYLGETRTLDMHIRALRGKLFMEADNIITVRGVGYKYAPGRK